MVALIAACGACVAPPSAADRAAVLPNDPASPVVGGVLAGGTVDDVILSRALDRAERSVVRVRNRSCDGLATGSGFVVGARQLVTNRHVVVGARSLTVDNTFGEPVTVKVASTALDDDLAIVTTVDPLPAALTLGVDPEPGALVTAMGFPLGGPFHLSHGRIVDLVDGARFQTKGRVVRSSVTIRPGNSGGPLLDEHGRVVGVIYAVELDTGLGLALPVSRLRAVLAQRILRKVIGTC